jgi:hypothetical protein
VVAGVMRIAAGWPCESLQYPKIRFQNPHESLIHAIVQQNLELRPVSHSRVSGTPGISEEGHVMQSASFSPILQLNFLGKPHLVAIPQTSIQAPCTHCLQETNSVNSLGPSGPEELGGRFGSANAHEDSPHKECTHRPDSGDVDRIAPVRLSGIPSAPPASCVSWPSSSSPSGPSLVTKTASHDLHAPWDIFSHEPRPEPGRGRSQASPFTTESRGKVTHDEQSYPKPTALPERVTLRLERTVSVADPPPPSTATSCGKEQFLHRNK